MSFDVKKVRKDFAILGCLEGELLRKDFVYLDSAATMQKPESVIQMEAEYYRSENANPWRGLYDLSVKSTNKLEEARAKVANFIGVEPNQITFLKNATEGLNVAAEVCRLEGFKKVEILEDAHHSAILPFFERFEAKMVSGFSDEAEILVATGMSNVTGEEYEFKRRKGQKVVLDLAQAVAHRKIEVGNADFAVFSAHKIGGPMGIGVLYAKNAHKPVIWGGEMVDGVKITDKGLDLTLADQPRLMEAGTTNVAGAVGLAAAIDYLEKQGDWREYVAGLTDYLAEKMRNMPEIEVYAAKNGIISFNVEGVHPHDTAQILAKYGIMVRSGYHCAQPYLEKQGWGPVVRASLALYNTKEEMDYLVEILEKVKQEMGI